VCEYVAMCVCECVAVRVCENLCAYVLVSIMVERMVRSAAST